MSRGISPPRYNLRSRSSDYNRPLTVSPTSPPNSTCSTPNRKDRSTAPSPKSNPRKRRKRRFSEIVDPDLIPQDIDINICPSPDRKRRRSNRTSTSRTIKFTLNKKSNETAIPSVTDHNLNASCSASSVDGSSGNRTRKIRRFRLTLNCKKKAIHSNDSKVLSRKVTLSRSSPLISSSRPRRQSTLRRMEAFAVPLPVSARLTRRNPFICCYSFLCGFRMGIASTLGSGTDLKAAMKILSQDLVSTRAKASVQTQKNSFLVYIKTASDELIGCGIVHVDHVWKRVNIEMFAVDVRWRGNGFASMMVFLIQYKMSHLSKYDLLVCAALDAVPFWMNKKFQFQFAHKDILEEHEIADEKTGGTRHLIWFGSAVRARDQLLQRMVASSEQ